LALASRGRRVRVPAQRECNSAGDCNPLTAQEVVNATGFQIER
jgi:hypothetical protein